MPEQWRKVVVEERAPKELEGVIAQAQARSADLKARRMRRRPPSLDRSGPATRLLEQARVIGSSDEAEGEQPVSMGDDVVRSQGDGPCIDADRGLGFAERLQR